MAPGSHGPSVLAEKDRTKIPPLCGSPQGLGQEGRKWQPKCHMPSRPGTTMGTFYTNRQHPTLGLHSQGRSRSWRSKAKREGLTADC